MIEHPRRLARPHLVRFASAALVAGTDFTWTPPLRQHIELLSVSIQLTTDATAVNRRMSLAVGLAAFPDMMILASGNHPASTVINYHFLRGCDTHPQVPSALGWHGPLPMGFIWQSPYPLITNINNLQAGDQITLVNARYMMWQDPSLIT